MNKADTFLKIFSLILVTVAFSFLFSYPAMLLWNGALVPAVTILQPVGWLQMWGINILFALMFVRSSYKDNK